MSKLVLQRLSSPIGSDWFYVVFLINRQKTTWLGIERHRKFTNILYNIKMHFCCVCVRVGVSKAHATNFDWDDRGNTTIIQTVVTCLYYDIDTSIIYTRKDVLRKR